MKKRLLLSVIVPVYNTAPYLQQCLDSIIHQTYQNLEIILAVDGGSTDSSAEICEDYAAADKRIKILYRPHEGLVCARKAAVSEAAGDYIAYVDSDDWIESDTYEKLLAAMGNLSPDILLYGYQSEYEEKRVICQYTIPVGYFDNTGLREEIYPRLLRSRRTYQRVFPRGNCLNSASRSQMLPNLQSDILECVWSKIVKRELLQKSQMLVPDDVIIGEDVVCGVHTLLLAHSVMVTRMAPYHYRVRTVSGSHGAIPVDQYRKMFSALYAVLSENPIFTAYLPRLYAMLLRNLLTCGYELFLEKDVSKALFGNLDGRRVALYGAGKCGREIYQKTKAVFPDRIVLWVDKQYERLQKENLPVEPVTELLRREYDIIIIALIDENICEEIKNDLINMGVAAEKIKYPSATPEALQAVNKIMQG